MYKSTKTFGHEIGLSACFRQWRADSHCHFLHGYALAIRFVFASNELDVRNWVVDFGSLKSLKSQLEDTFDHKLLVSEDDPALGLIRSLAKEGVADVVVVEKCGCEAFARLIFDTTEIWLKDNGYAPRAWLESVEVSEHGANSAIYEPTDSERVEQGHLIRQGV
jgi:6-pyruvoyltetrahydropterin/6-carboxytetrahydropterin synthase